MDPIEERPVLSLTDDVADLRKGLIESLGRIGVRTNLQVPKDGSEVVEQLSYTRKIHPNMTADQLNLPIEDGFAFFTLTTNNNRVIHGIEGGTTNDPGEGRVIHFSNAQTSPVRTVTFIHLSGIAIQANRILLPDGISLTLLAGESATFFYDVTSLRWRTRLL